MKVASLALSLVTAALFRGALCFFPLPEDRNNDTESWASGRQAAPDNSSEPLTGVGWFEQYIDHDDLELGTFRQLYVYDITHWKGPGSPVIFYTPGETALNTSDCLTNNGGIKGMYADAVGGAVVVLEHRYWGRSSPYDELTVENLRHLTVKQAIMDATYFARDVLLPFDPTGQTNAPDAPWIYVGASYAGALAAWTERAGPAAFWAYHAISAPVMAVRDFWQYFEPIRKGMPKNCSEDISVIVDWVDFTLRDQPLSERLAMKAMFGLQDLEYDDDAAHAIFHPMGYWQNTRSLTYGTVYEMCDAIRDDTAEESIHIPEGLGLTKALPNYARWYREKWLPGRCDKFGYNDWNGKRNVQCFDSHNSSMEAYNDFSVANTVNRQWMWILCSEPFYWWQTGAPERYHSLMSRLATPDYYQHLCSTFFPGARFARGRGGTEEDVNSWLGGWSRISRSRNLLFSNGEFDPWRSASVSSEFRPGGPLPSTPTVPVILIEGSRHGEDLQWREGSSKAVWDAMQQEIQIISDWVKNFYMQHPIEDYT